MLEASLLRLGYRVHTAGGIEAAVEAAGKLPAAPDLLISDMVLPDGGGRALAARLQQRYPNLKVLLMSGYPDEDLLARGIQGEGPSFLQKPFALSILATKVDELLARKGS
jgi:DNA-binding NtrC family response regulator